MEIRFEFNLDKAIQSMAFLAHHVPGVEKVKLTKLLYLADKEHFLRHGYPITGDMQYAMKWGPVPSTCLNALDGEMVPNTEKPFQFLHVDDNRVLLKADPGHANLTESELRILRSIVAQHGKKNCWILVEETHRLPEYQEIYVPGTSTRIPYEIILKHSGDPAHFRLNRPVISKEMRQHMACPFPE